VRRAIIASAATVVGLVALLDYKSHGTISQSHVAVKTGSPHSTTPPATGAPATTTPTTPTSSPSSSSSPSSAATAPSSTATQQYTGTDVTYRYGDIQVRITMAGGRITNITVPEESASDPRSESINSQAVPILTQEALAAQNLNFDVVSGATFTSDAFAQSLQSALSQAGK
jgi:uncharacterized protein with FMN-binding domain